MPRKQQGWITFQSSQEERQILERYSQQSQRTKTEILRELLRSLPHQPPQPNAKASSQKVAAIEVTELKVSARNKLQGTIREIVLGTVNAEITLEIAPNIELVAIITKTSAEELGLAKGQQVYAVIKSNNIMIARRC